MSDIFVVLPPVTQDGSIIFGKNSDRPPSEVQEVVYIAEQDHLDQQKLQCTFVQVDQVEHTHGVVLSKPAWSWGAEMGANEHGVCIGNTAAWNKLCQPGDHEERLIGVDFVRLGLERSTSAKGALDVITELLVKYGQTGPCCEDQSFSQWTYNNSFIIADRQEAWILETVGQHWAAQKVTDGARNISNSLTISTQIDAMSTGLKENAQDAGFWNPEDGEFDFAKAYSSEYSGIALSDSQRPVHRYEKGKTLLQNMATQGDFSLENMFAILRDEESSISFRGELITAASQVSVLSPPSSKTPCCHWFTASPDPRLSVFKPFIFCPNAVIGNVTASNGVGAGFQTTTDRSHLLNRMHEKGRQLMDGSSPRGQVLFNTMRQLEKDCIEAIKEFLQDFDDSKLPEIADLFKDVAESEVKFYK